MSEISDSEKLKYLRNIIFLNIQKKEMIELAKYSIKGQIPIQCKLVNKDIINDYMNDGISTQIYIYLNTYMINNKINNFIELYNENHINNIINKCMHKINEFDLSDKYFNPGLLMVEDSKISDIEYPSNFFILRKFVFDQIMAVSACILVEFKTYDVLIGKEGIFIWDEKTNEIKEFKLIIYYIKEIKNDDNINKIILLKNKTTEIINNLDKYLQLTKLKNKAGYFNIIDNGIIIGYYINIVKNNNYKYIDSYNGHPNRAKIKVLEGIVTIFDRLLPIILCLSNIENLKKSLLSMKEIDKKMVLIKTFINIIKKLDSDSDKYDLDSDINDFLDIFYERNLYEKCEIPENKIYIWKNLINLLLDEFQNELKQKQNNESQIFDIFYGIKNINSKEESFNIMDIIDKGNGNMYINLINLINYYKKDEKIQSFPKVMIVFIENKKNMIFIPSEFELKPSDNEKKEKYKLRSSILLWEENLACIVRNKNSNEFYKLIVNDENKVEKEKFEDISKGYIYFYEIEETIIKKENINKSKINNNHLKRNFNNLNNINNNMKNQYQLNNN